MTTLVTLFSISLAGIIVMLGFKYAEGKSGRHLFLPGWLHARDEQIERMTLFVLRKIFWWMKHKAIKGVYVARLSGVAVVRKMSERKRQEGSLDKNRSASMYLKELNAQEKESVNSSGGRGE